MFSVCKSVSSLSLLRIDVNLFCVYRSGVPDGQPKLLLSLIPDYPMLNFMLTTSIYVAVSRKFSALESSIQRWSDWLMFPCLQVSYRLFQLTNTLKVAFVPSKDDKRLTYNLIAAVVISSILYTLSFIFLRIPQMLVRISPLMILFLPWLVVIKYVISGKG